MKISVALASYNGGKYIIEQLESLFSQSRLPDEVIIYDDCSKDQTRKLIKEYIKKRSLQNSWKLFVNDDNKGYADNFHKAIHSCSGDIIFFCDQDDVWKKNKIEVMAGIMERNHDIQVLCSRITNFNSKDGIVTSPDIQCEDVEVHKVELNEQSIYLQVPGCAMAIRKEFFKKTEKYWYSGLAHDEYAWKFGLCFEGVYIYEGSLIDRRCHDKNTSMHKMRKRQERIAYVDNLEKSYATMMECIEDNGVLNEESKKLIAHNKKACELRRKVLLKKQVFYLFNLLIKYSDTVKTKKTFLIETYLALKNKL